MKNGIKVLLPTYLPTDLPTVVTINLILVEANDKLQIVLVERQLLHHLSITLLS